MSKKFQIKKEDFLCLHCGKKVQGNGYTNHCPHCLYSKHVDIYPGDRASKCGGIMEPVYLCIYSSNRMLIVHRCKKCGHEKPNKISKNDNMEEVLKLPIYARQK